MPTDCSDQPVVLSRFIVWHLRFLQLICLCPVPIAIRQSQRRDQQATGHDSERCFTVAAPDDRHKFNIAKARWQHAAYLSVHLLGFATWHLVTLNRVRVLVTNNNNFSKFNDIVHYITSSGSHIITLLELLLKRRQLHRFLLIYAKLHNAWASPRCLDEWRLYSRTLLSVAVFFLVIIVTNVNYLTEVWGNYQWLHFYAYFVPCNLMSHIRFVQFSLYVDFIRGELEQLSNRFVELAKRSENLASVKIPYREERDICRQLNELMTQHHDIYKMHLLMKESCAWSLVAYFLQVYVTLLCEFYWSYWMIYHSKELREFLMIIPSALNIFQLLVTTRNLRRSTAFLGHHLHSMRFAVNNTNITTRLQNFSYQLMHEHIVINPLGLFTLSGHLTLNILGSITTYMIFFIQFMHRF